MPSVHFKARCQHCLYSLVDDFTAENMAFSIPSIRYSFHCWRSETLFSGKSTMSNRIFDAYSCVILYVERGGLPCIEESRSMVSTPKHPRIIAYLTPQTFSSDNS